MAINVAHQLRGMEIPVYFASLRGMESKDELVSKLLSIFTDTKQVLHISPAHWLIRFLQQLQNPFVLILDNADDLLESRDTRRKEQVLLFISEVLAQCNHIKLLFTTRESLDYLSHTFPIHLERVGALDEVASGDLVKSLLPDLSDDDCSSIVKECGQVPLAMRLLCSIMKEENVSLNEMLEELKDLPLVEVLDSESYSDDARLKVIINKSFERLTDRERDAIVSLAVFPGCFRIEEAKAVLDVNSVLAVKKIIRTLERKSLIDSSDSFSSFTIHSILRSFIDEERITDRQVIGAVFHAAQLRFYDHYIAIFGVANEKCLKGHSTEAFSVFLGRRENIILSLTNGTREDELYPQAVDVLSKAELFLYAVLPEEELLFKNIYGTAVKESQKRKNLIDEQKLLAAKSFSHWGWFSSDHQSWDHSLLADYSDSAHYPAKLQCYFGIYQLLCGKLDEGISSLNSSVFRLSRGCDEEVLKVLVYQVLANCHRSKQEHEMVSYFKYLCNNESKPTSTYMGLGGCDIKEDYTIGYFPPLDNFPFILITSKLLSYIFEGGTCKEPDNEISSEDCKSLKEFLNEGKLIREQLPLVLSACCAQPESVAVAEMLFGPVLRFLDFFNQLSPDMLLILKKNSLFCDPNLFVGSINSYLDEMSENLPELEHLG